MNKYIHTTLRGSFIAIMMMMGVSMWAQNGTNVAKIGDTEYATLQEAIDAAEAGATINLLADVSVEQTLLIEKNLTIDGKNDESTNFTITSNVNNRLGAFYVNALTCNFIIQNATITGGANATMAVCAYRGPANLTQGTVSSVVPNGNSGNIITLTNCNVSNFHGWPNNYVGAVYGFSESTVNLTSCTFSNNTTSKSQDANSASGADVWVGAAGKLNISGGSLLEAFANSNSTDNVTVNISNSATVAELSICVSYKEDGSTYIPAITIDNARVTDLKTEVADTPIPANSITTQNGGTVTHQPDIEVAKILNGTATKAFSSVDAAITAATADQVITLIADLTENLTITTEKTVSIDLGAHLGSYNLTFNGTGTLTLADGTVSGNLSNSGTGTLAITGGTYTGTIAKSSGTIAISGGTFANKPDKEWIASGYEFMVTADDEYEVAAAGTAEAQIDDLKYKSIGKAILSAGVEETTIKLLKEVAADITIPAGANITFDVATGVTIAKPITVTAGGTLNLANGTFTGTITNNGTLNLSGDVVLYEKPNAYTCSPEGYGLVVNAEGHYVVGNVANAEAQIGEEKYMTIGDAITVAGTNATTITLLKDPAEAIAIPFGANITLEIQNVATTFESLTKAITVEGTLTITSGTISGAITIAAFDATVKIASGVTLPTVALSTELQNENVLKSSTTKESGYTSYWVEKKVKAMVDAAITGDGNIAAARILAANNTLSNITGLTTNQSLTITVTGVILSGSDVKAATFDVKLIGADGEPITTQLTDAIGFNLPILYSSTLTNPWVNLWHDATDITGTSNIQGAGENQFIALSSTSFSPFKYEIVKNPIAQIGETKYETVAAAIEKATATETEIKLLRDVDAQTAISVSSGQNVKLTIGTHTVSGNITNGGTLAIWDGTNDGTDGVISGTITNTGTLNISDKANVSGTIEATAGTVKISGGTIGSTITTSGTAVLNISGGNFTFTDRNNDPAITIGSGTNTISGTANVSGSISVNTATLTISGGTFSNTITATGTVDSHKGIINISGGTFTGTILEGGYSDVAISGGTHTNLPGVALCANGYMPIENEGTPKTYGMTNSWPVVDDTDLTKNTHLANGGYSVATATYTRNSGMVSAGNAATTYGTICLPFEITAQPSGMTLYKATSISGNTLNITAVSDYTTAIPAGTPLIFELGEAAKTLTVTSRNATVDTKDLVNPTDANILRGTYSELNLTASTTPAVSNCYYLNGDAFHQAVTSLTVPSFRAYLYQAPQQNGAPMPNVLYISSESNAETSVSETFEMESVTEVFDLNGRKQSGLQKGMNIVRRADGSSFKVIVK